MTDPYDLRSNIKGKPGSQGTLFQVRDKGLLNPQQRWPRGYTPERQAEVSQALSSVPVEGRYEADAHHQRARVVDTVSRSTMPTRYLPRLKSIGADVAEGTSGTYWGGTQRHLAVDMLDRRRWPGDSSGKTLLHEMGHHHDAVADINFNDPTVHAMRMAEHNAASERAARGLEGPPSTTEKLLAEKRISAGVSEATADDYMTEHYRTRGRNPQPVTQGRYEANFTPGERARKYPGYNEIRPPQRNLGPQFRQGELF
jgi:hypothetical protein